MTEAPDYNDLVLELKKFYSHVHSGKVRDSFRLPSDLAGESKKRLVVVSDRVSIFDFMLGFDIPGKGEILNAFNIAARLHLARAIPHFQHDIIAFGGEIDGHLSEDYFENYAPLRKNAVVVKELQMVPIECVVRGNNTGSLFKAYKAGEAYCGHDFGVVEERTMKEGARLEPSLFTPTTKAKEGHDMPVPYQAVEDRYPALEYHSMRVFEIMRMLAEERGLIFADSKFKFGGKLVNYVPRRFDYILADEVATPDSSRFWDLAAWLDAQLRDALPPSMDKQLLRNWGKSVGIDKLDPKNPEHRAHVCSLTPPLGLVKDMVQQMQNLFERLYGMSVNEFQQKVMKVDD